MHSPLQSSNMARVTQLSATCCLGKTALNSRTPRTGIGMVIYGDPQFEVSAAEFFRDLRAKVLSVNSQYLEDLRAVLIKAGQLEQAIFDLPPNVLTPETCADVAKLTDYLALA